MRYQYYQNGKLKAEFKHAKQFVTFVIAETRYNSIYGLIMDYEVVEEYDETELDGCLLKAYVTLKDGNNV